MLDTSVYLTLLLIGFILIFIGTLVIFLGLMGRGKGKVEGGGVIIIGPIPIVFGSSQKVSTILVVLAIILTILVLTIYIIPLATR